MVATVTYTIALAMIFGIKKIYKFSLKK